jgi:UDP-3-O-[3-hydroxymyristoyl] glucosamine N-acyltransferase
LGHILEGHEHAYRLNRAKYYYLAYMHFIGNHFYPFTLSSKIKSAKADEFKVVTKNFNKILFSGIAIPRTTYISNNCYIGQKSTIGSNATI